MLELEQIIFIILSALTLGSAFVVVTNPNLFRAGLFLIVALGGVAGMFVLLEAGFLAVVQVFVYAGAIAILILFAVMLTRRVMNPDTPQQNTQAGASLGLALVLLVLLLLVLWPNPITLPEVDIALGQLLILLGAIVLLFSLVVLARERAADSGAPLSEIWSIVAMAAIIIVFGIVFQTLWSEPPRLQIKELTLGGIEWLEKGADARVGGIQDLGRALVDSEQYVVPFEVASVLLLVAMIGAAYIVYPRRGEAPTDAEVATIQPGAEEQR